MITALFALMASQWSVETAQDPMTDKTVAQATLRGDGGALIYRCGGEDGPTLALMPSRYLGPGFDGYGGMGDVALRFDDEPQESQTKWFYSRGLVVDTDKARTIAFLDRASQATRLRVRAIGRAGEQDFDFALEGAGEALARVRPHC